MVSFNSYVKLPEGIPKQFTSHIPNLSPMTSATVWGWSITIKVIHPAIVKSSSPMGFHPSTKQGAGRCPNSWGFISHLPTIEIDMTNIYLDVFPIYEVGDLFHIYFISNVSWRLDYVCPLFTWLMWTIWTLNHVAKHVFISYSIWTFISPGDVCQPLRQNENKMSVQQQYIPSPSISLE